MHQKVDIIYNKDPSLLHNPPIVSIIATEGFTALFHF